MGTDQVIGLSRMVLVEVATLVAPLLVVTLLVSLVINLIQVLTSLQDQALAAVPRLLAAGATLFFLMPWMWRHLAVFTLHIMADFHEVLQ